MGRSSVQDEFGGGGLPASERGSEGGARGGEPFARSVLGERSGWRARLGVRERGGLRQVVLITLELAGGQRGGNARRSATAHGRHAASALCRGGQRGAGRAGGGGRPGGRGPGRLRCAGARVRGVTRAASASGPKPRRWPAKV
jgi:hypothetical protein